MQLRDLDVPGVVEPAVTDAVAEDDDAVRQLVVDALILFERLADVILKSNAASSAIHGVTDPGNEVQPTRKAKIKDEIHVTI